MQDKILIVNLKTIISMKQTLLLILAVLFVSCNTQKSNDIELAVFHAGIKWDKNDSIIINVRCELYAQIEEDGNCILNIDDYRKGNRFITFKINKEILDSVYRLVYIADSDTTVWKREPFMLYDGPSIRIAGKNKNGKPVQLRFIHSESSNLNCLKLYNYIDSISRKPQNNSDIDTTKILRAKEKLMKDIYKKEKALMPPYCNDTSIHFIAPVLKKQK